ncbi:uncharacterized protein DUF4102 [Azospirillum baldaniorum]|uniref:tyrosine-type recombinase/integrase n=1 Tax=Azospirillum baldaniorum TaxID=1064539 RepID=UPI0011AE11E5|nr:site-specific integrase [Azospirillum baldaniorum]TWA66072.1 uncharacterized protein DUF4102 [Azospirillum baldaniorum]
MTKLTKLTDTSIRNLKCVRREEFRDDIVPGLWLRVGAGDKGSKTWVLRYRQDGAQRSATLGKFPDMGLAAARLAATSIRDGSGTTKEGKQGSSKPSPTFAETAEAYIASHTFQRNRSALERAQTIRTGIIPYVGAIDTAVFSRRDAKGLVDRYLSEGKDAMAIRVQNLMSKVLTYALDEEIREYNPMAGMKSPAKVKARERFLTRTELRDLWQYLNTEAAKKDPMRRAIRWMVVTGQRRNECLYIHSREVDITQKRWTLPSERSKNKKAHVIPLTDWHIEILGDPGHNGFYFPNPKLKYDIINDRSVNNHVTDYCDTRGVDPHFTPHDFRRTMTTYLAEIGIPEEHVQRVLNHTRKTVTGRHYDHYSYLPEKLNALEKWKGILTSL